MKCLWNLVEIYICEQRSIICCELKEFSKGQSFLRKLKGHGQPPRIPSSLDSLGPRKETGWVLGRPRLMFQTVEFSYPSLEEGKLRLPSLCWARCCGNSPEGVGEELKNKCVTLWLKLMFGERRSSTKDTSWATWRAF